MGLTAEAITAWVAYGVIASIQAPACGRKAPNAAHVVASALDAIQARLLPVVDGVGRGVA